MDKVRVSVIRIWQGEVESVSGETFEGVDFRELVLSLQRSHAAQDAEHILLPQGIVSTNYNGMVTTVHVELVRD